MRESRSWPIYKVAPIDQFKLRPPPLAAGTHVNDTGDFYYNQNRQQNTSKNKKNWYCCWHTLYSTLKLYRLLEKYRYEHFATLECWFSRKRLDWCITLSENAVKIHVGMRVKVDNDTHLFRPSYINVMNFCECTVRLIERWHVTEVSSAPDKTQRVKGERLAHRTGAQ